MVLDRRRVERVLTAAGSFLAALAIGYFMQNGHRIQQGFADPSDKTEATEGTDHAALPGDGAALALVRNVKETAAPALD